MQPRPPVRRRHPVWWWWAGAGVVVVLLGTWVATAAGAFAPDPHPGRGVAPTILTDRGAGATVTALRELDACRLVNPAALSPDDPGTPPTTSREGPHECEVGAAGGLVEVRVGDGFGDRMRWGSAPIVVGGVKAYRSRPIQNDRYSRYCSVAIPVTFAFAVEFLLRYGDDPDPCPTTERVAAAAVPLLRSPPPPPPPGEAPLADVDPCAVLAAAGPFDPTATNPDVDPTALEPGIDRCVVRLGDRRTIELAFLYRLPPDRAGPGCGREWVVPGTRVGTRSVALVRVGSSDDGCGVVDAVVDRLPGAIRVAPPAERAVRPVRLFAPDEPDMAYAGPCADLLFECFEPTEVDLPDGVDALLRASGADTSYTCRMAQDSVHRVFGPTLRPTIYGDYCHFVDERHEIDVAVAAGSWFDLRQYGNGGGDDIRRDGLVAGHEVRYREWALLGDRHYDWTIRPRPGPPDPALDDRGGRGVIMVDVVRRPPRGELLGSDDMPSDPATVAAGEALVADLLVTRFR